MDPQLLKVVKGFEAVAERSDARDRVEQIMKEVVADPLVAEAVAGRLGLQALEDIAIHRSGTLTVLAAAIPPGFSAAPHNHNLWSVVGVCRGREDNEFFESGGNGLTSIGHASVDGPGVLANDADVIHSICNPLDEPLLAVHAYGGDLLSTPRSNWDPETHEEIPFDWNRVKSEAAT